MEFISYFFSSLQCSNIEEKTMEILFKVKSHMAMMEHLYKVTP